MDTLIRIILALSLLVNIILGYEYFSSRGVQSEIASLQSALNSATPAGLMAGCGGNQPDAATWRDLRTKFINKTELDGRYSHSGMVCSADLLNLIFESNGKIHNAIEIIPMYDVNNQPDPFSIMLKQGDYDATASAGAPNGTFTFTGATHVSPLWCPNVCPFEK